MSAAIELFKNNLPKKAYSCDVFELDNKVRYLKYALDKKYIQPNNFNSRKWLIYDIDNPISIYDIYDAGLPIPTLFVSNPANGHAHAFYMLKKEVHLNSFSSQKAMRFAANVDKAMGLALGADFGYAGLLAKNAIHQTWEVQTIIDSEISYDLNDFLEYKAISENLQPLNSNEDFDFAYGLGRNCIVFEQLRKWSYKAIRQGWPEYERWREAVYQRGLMINLSLKTDRFFLMKIREVTGKEIQSIEPLPEREVWHIATSIARFTDKRFSAAGFSAVQAERGRRGGKVSKGGGRKPLEQEVINQIILMNSLGYTQREIVDRLKISHYSVNKYLTSKC